MSNTSRIVLLVHALFRIGFLLFLLFLVLPAERGHDAFWKAQAKWDAAQAKWNAAYVRGDALGEREAIEESCAAIGGCHNK